MNSKDWIFIDLETTGLDAQVDRIIEIAAITRIDQGEKNIFHHLVNPGIPVPTHITRLTGIANDMLAGAPSFAELREDLLRILENKIIVAHSAYFDVSFLEAVLGTPLKNLYLDTIDLARIVQYNTASYSLRYLTKEFSLEQQPNHRALADTLALENLFHYLLDEARRLPLSALQEIHFFLGHNKTGLSMLFEELLRERISKYDFTEAISPEWEDNLAVTGEKREVHWDTGLLEQMFLPGGHLAKGLDSYQKRPQQIQMLKLVAKSFMQNRHLVVEAGTGVGKTLAYLVPVLTWAVSRQEKVVVATHTIALQEQILQYDIKFLTANLPFSFRAQVLKGRNNYICLYKWKNTKDRALSMNWQEKLLMARISLWLKKNTSGDRDTINLRDWEVEFFTQLASSRDNCLGNMCPFSKDCFYQKAKFKAQGADLIIVNHSLLLSDLKIGDAILPKYNYVIIDEAHHLEDEGTRQFSENFTLRELQKKLFQLHKRRDIQYKSGLLNYWVQHLISLLGEDNPVFIMIKEKIKEAESTLGAITKTMEDIVSFCQGRSLETYRVHEQTASEEWWKNISLLFDNMRLEIGFLCDGLDKIFSLIAEEMGYPEGDNPLREIKIIQNQLEGDREVLGEFFTPNRDEEKVYWLEFDPVKADVRIYITPLKTGKYFHELLFSNKASAVLTSATLSIDGSFAYLIERLGLSADLVDTVQIPSPFCYDEQALLIVDNSLPDPSRTREEIYSLAVGQALLNIIQSTKGNTLVLFTSRKQMRFVFEYLYEPLRQQGLELFADGINGRKINLLNELKENSQAIVFGTNTFWEGIDLPGAALTSIIMVRLPFYPPNMPLAEARTEALKKEGKDGFRYYSLPQAVLKFRQGYGRLIRTMEDCGVVVVLDNRLVTKNYGQIFIKSLPNTRYLCGDTDYVVENIRLWFERLRIKT